jgi:hypothetical protein
MSIGWKAGRVSELFGVRLWNSFTTELLRFPFSLLLFALCRFPHCVSIVIDLGLSIAFHGCVFRWS